MRVIPRFQYGGYVAPQDNTGVQTIFDSSIIDISNYKLKLPNWNEQDIYK